MLLSYENWLYDLVDLRNFQIESGKKYTILMNYLYNKEFYWVNPLDKNRAYDGEILRDLYEEYSGNDTNYLVKVVKSGTCSVLEMVIALCGRADGSPICDVNTTFLPNIFWKVVKNLGFLEFSDENFDFEKVDYIVDNFLERNYEYSGNGGIFPLREPRSDQRDEDLWAQMHNYIEENF